MAHFCFSPFSKTSRTEKTSVAVLLLDLPWRAFAISGSSKFWNLRLESATTGSTNEPTGPLGILFSLQTYRLKRLKHTKTNASVEFNIKRFRVHIKLPWAPPFDYNQLATMIFKVLFLKRKKQEGKIFSLRQFVRNCLVYFACFRWLFFLLFFFFQACLVPILLLQHMISYASAAVYSSNIEINMHIKHGRLWKRQKGRLWKWRLWIMQKWRLWKRPKVKALERAKKKALEKAQEKVAPGTFQNLA